MQEKLGLNPKTRGFQSLTNRRKEDKGLIIGVKPADRISKSNENRT